MFVRRVVRCQESLVVISFYETRDYIQLATGKSETALIVSFCQGESCTVTEKLKGILVRKRDDVKGMIISEMVGV